MEQNIYKREVLFNEVWENPITKVAEKYGVSDVMIHKICKKMNIPTPTLGHWSKIRAGHNIERIPLPEYSEITEFIGNRDYVKPLKPENSVLSFMSNNEKQSILDEAEKIMVPENKIHFHKKISLHKNIVEAWNKSDTRSICANRQPRSYKHTIYNPPPFMAGMISKEVLPRAYKILTILFLSIENLGDHVNDDLSLIIRGETVKLQVYERQTETLHKLTKEEEKDLAKYEEDVKRYSWTSKPQIRKYDHTFNGKLVIRTRENKYFRDSDTSSLDQQLGSVLIDIYETSELVRINREKREAEQRAYQERVRKENERKLLYQQEIDKVKMLEELAIDFNTASLIRNYADAIEQNSHEQKDLIEWARKKADWYDPTINREDEILGKRRK